MDICDLTIHELHSNLKSRKVSSVEATKALLARIETVEPQVCSFITVTPEKALADAEAADRRIAAGSMDVLTGIPLALKDIFLTEGIRTTCGSRILHNFVPPYSASSYEKLKELNTDGIVPTSHAVPMENSFREDVAGPSIGIEKALANAPDRVESFYRVPKVIE